MGWRVHAVLSIISTVPLPRGRELADNGVLAIGRLQTWHDKCKHCACSARSLLTSFPGQEADEHSRPPSGKKAMKSDAFRVRLVTDRRAIRSLLNMTSMTTPSTRLPCRQPTRLLLCMLALGMMPVTAHAYIDPGTGSMLFQSLLAVLFGIGVAFRKIRDLIARLWAFVLRRPRPDYMDTKQ